MIAVRVPELLMDAMAGADEFQMPPGVALDNSVVEPTHTELEPVMGLTIGNALMVKADALVPVPEGVVTAMDPVVAEAGSWAEICVFDMTVKEAGVPLNVTEDAPERCVPVIVTVVAEP